ncbi:hypothetical protein K1X41_09960 [Leucobacter luti]|nr:hypothetical protein K1X41_09960 [Leucobacter luti]
MLLTADAREPLVIVKAGSAAKLALQSTCRDITPGCHMRSSHWIALSPSGNVPTLLIDDLVTTPSALVEPPPPRKEVGRPRPLRALEAVTRSRAATYDRPRHLTKGRP